VEPLYNSFLDYDGLTEVNLYVPGMGNVSIPPSICMNKYVQVDFFINLVTGECNIQIMIYKNEQKDGTLIFTKGSVQWGIDIPINANTSRSLSNSVIKGAVIGAAAIVGGKAGSIPTAVLTSGAVGVALDGTPNSFSQGGSSNSIYGAGDMGVYLTIGRPIPTDNYLNGSSFATPCTIQKKGLDMRGYGLIYPIDIRMDDGQQLIPKMLDKEILKEKLKEGFIL